jgi:uncharacterized membrane protein
MKTTATYHNLSFTEAKTYLFATLFVAGNIILPQLAHFVPNGGPMLLPIYFFTLIAAYKFGIRTGMLTAILSPVINSLLFGMPMLAMLPIILIKSSLLAIAAAVIARSAQRTEATPSKTQLVIDPPSLRGGKAAVATPSKRSLGLISSLLIIVLSYQLVGTLIEWAFVKDFFIAVQDFRIGLPGMALQVVGGWLILTRFRG